MKRRTAIVISLAALFSIFYIPLMPHESYSEQTKEQLLKEIAGLQNTNIGLQKEIDRLKRLNEAFEKKSKELYVQAESAKGNKGMASIAESMNKERLALKKKNEELAARVREEGRRAEADKAKIYFELGNAYTKAKMFREAIDAYTVSLGADPKNAEVHYNLGLLYQRYQGDTDKAVFHFQKYLKSHPPPDREKEVKYLLGMLRSGREWVNVYY